MVIFLPPVPPCAVTLPSILPPLICTFLVWLALTDCALVLVKLSVSALMALTTPLTVFLLSVIFSVPAPLFKPNDVISLLLMLTSALSDALIFTALAVDCLTVNFFRLPEPVFTLPKFLAWSMFIVKPSLSEPLTYKPL